VIVTLPTQDISTWEQNKGTHHTYILW
jgi:hypothetical protein